MHSLPTAGNDLVLIGLLTVVGLALGLLCGFATHLRVCDGITLARVGRLAGGLLIAGIGARMVFAFSVSHGAEPAIRRQRAAAGSATRAGWIVTRGRLNWMSAPIAAAIRVSWPSVRLTRPASTLVM